MEAEFESIESSRLWQQKFHTIREKSGQHDFSTKEARKVENRMLNRYKDVNPYDHSRVVLVRSDVDYINASLVPVEKAGRQYILTQGPLVGTLVHFWLMIWEKNTRGIVMLNKLIEKNTVKCHQYWPDHEIKLEAVDLTVSFVAESAKENYICRTFRVRDVKTEESRDIIQFHYINWPDFGVPQGPNDFLDFLEDVRSSGSLESDVGPAVIHCSAGIGRSGTFCVVDSILKMIEDGRVQETEIDLQEILLDMRRYRMSLIQTAEQLRFSYLAIIEALRRRAKRSPYLSRKQDEDAPPPPPHRLKPVLVVNPTEASSSDDNDEQLDNNELVPSANGDHISCPSTDLSSTDESEGEQGPPPPLPPKDIPAEEQKANLIKDNLEEDLRKFEQEILAYEIVQPDSEPDKVDPPTASETELLLRKRQQDQKIKQKVQAIKKNIQDAEAANQRKSWFDNFGISFVVMVGAGILMYRIYDYVRG